MSRTYRKRAHPATLNWHDMYSYWKDNKVWPSDIPTKKDISMHRSDSNKDHYCGSLPQWFRNSVNRTRRRKDAREIYKAVNLFEYEEQCSRWNCKDNNAWGYW